MYAGNPSEELVKYKTESCKQDFIIIVPQNASWAELIEKCYGDKAKKVTRYAIKKEIDTQEDHRRKGLAYACGAKLILECLEKGLYPSWDAQNKWSVALAEKTRISV